MSVVGDINIWRLSALKKSDLMLMTSNLVVSNGSELVVMVKVGEGDDYVAPTPLTVESLDHAKFPEQLRTLRFKDGRSGSPYSPEISSLDIEIRSAREVLLDRAHRILSEWRLEHDAKQLKAVEA